ncbi:hypothetical protein D8L93_07180 [Sodalis-like symbiont of Bactericera trigonica]|nr:hypothetical protein D8L93_07180 [Sodalis-like symbiont of Bactericera trigonica]
MELFITQLFTAGWKLNYTAASVCYKTNAFSVYLEIFWPLTVHGAAFFIPLTTGQLFPLNRLMLNTKLFF